MFLRVTGYRENDYKNVFLKTLTDGELDNTRAASITEKFMKALEEGPNYKVSAKYAKDNDISALSRNRLGAFTC